MSLIKSNVEIAMFNAFNRFKKACFIKIASFSLIIVAISPFMDLIARVIEDILNEVYFKAVQHLFLFS